MKRQEGSEFKTHVPEPRWQQVVSVLIALAIVVWIIVVIVRGH